MIRTNFRTIYRFRAGGPDVATSTETMLKVVEPATEGILAELPHATAEDADAAIAKAKAASPAWRDVAPGDRAAILRSIANAITARLEDLARLESRNVGKPISDARGEVGMVASTF